MNIHNKAEKMWKNIYRRTRHKWFTQLSVSQNLTDRHKPWADSVYVVHCFDILVRLSLWPSNLVLLEQKAINLGKTRDATRRYMQEISEMRLPGVVTFIGPITPYLYVSRDLVPFKCIYSTCIPDGIYLLEKDTFLVLALLHTSSKISSQPISTACQEHYKLQF